MFTNYLAKSHKHKHKNKSTSGTEMDGYGIAEAQLNCSLSGSYDNGQNLIWIFPNSDISKEVILLNVETFDIFFYKDNTCMNLYSCSRMIVYKSTKSFLQILN